MCLLLPQPCYAGVETRCKPCMLAVSRGGCAVDCLRNTARTPAIHCPNACETLPESTRRGALIDSNRALPELAERAVCAPLVLAHCLPFGLIFRGVVFFPRLSPRNEGPPRSNFIRQCATASVSKHPPQRDNRQSARVKSIVGMLSLQDLLLGSLVARKEPRACHSDLSDCLPNQWGDPKALRSYFVQIR
jgi:hypothetical protein